MTVTEYLDCFTTSDGYPVNILAHSNVQMSGRVAASTSITGGCVVTDDGSGLIHPNVNATFALGIANSAIDNSSGTAKYARPIAYTIYGVVNVVAEYAITYKDALGIADNGKVKTYASGMRIGTALSTCTASGDIIKAFVNFLNPPQA